MRRLVPYSIASSIFWQLHVAKLSKIRHQCYHCDMATASVAPSATQRRVLIALKRRGEATADELASALEISSSAVRQHLSALRSAGFIAARQERGQPGRPADKYHATPLTEPLFVVS